MHTHEDTASRDRLETSLLSVEQEELLWILLEEEGFDLPQSQQIPARERRANEQLPLSATQQQFWLLDQISAGSPAYSMPVLMRLAGPLDVAVLAQSLSTI